MWPSLLNYMERDRHWSHSPCDSVLTNCWMFFVQQYHEHIILWEAWFYWKAQESSLRNEGEIALVQPTWGQQPRQRQSREGSETDRGWNHRELNTEAWNSVLYLELYYFSWPRVPWKLRKPPNYSPEDMCPSPHRPSCCLWTAPSPLPPHSQHKSTGRFQKNPSQKLLVPHELREPRRLRIPVHRACWFFQPIGKVRQARALHYPLSGLLLKLSNLKEQLGSEVQFRPSPW